MCKYCYRPEGTREEKFEKIQALTHSLNNSTEDLTTLVYDDEPFDGVLEIIIHKATEIKRLRDSTEN